MGRLLLVLALVSCSHDDPVPAVDAAPAVDSRGPDGSMPVPIDAIPAPAVDWSVFGNPCQGGAIGIVTCTATDGTPGICKRAIVSPPPADGLYDGVCKPNCYSQPPFDARCPDDGHAVDTGNGQDCHCEQN